MLFSVLLSLIATAVATPAFVWEANTDWVANEYTNPSCAGSPSAPHSTLEAQIKPETQSLYTSTPNDTTYRWMAYADYAQGLCSGDYLGDFVTGCNDLATAFPGKKVGCAFPGSTATGPGCKAEGEC
ncbi:hypothetical protein F5Y15DRAFT_419319 [Xylariaceae sp. FL0016]|nr:hypothetical protein F5Y15DRAFT_419319 [Xylariaceae sp. FL0016]